LNDHNIVPVAYSPIGRLGINAGAENIMNDPLILQLADKYDRTPV